MTDLKILSILHPFIYEGKWFTSETLKKNRFFNPSKIDHQVYSRLSAILNRLYTNGYLDRQDRKRIIFSKRGITYRGKYAYRLKIKYQSLPKNQLKLEL